MKKLLKIGIPVVIAVMLMGIGGVIALTTDSVRADGADITTPINVDVTPGNGWNCNGDCPGNGSNGKCLQDCDGDCDGDCSGYGNGICANDCEGTCNGYGRSIDRAGKFAGKGFCGRAGGGCGNGECLPESY